MNKLTEKITAAGGRIFQVGGSVRDEFLGLESKDLDCEVFGLTELTLEQVLAEVATEEGFSLSLVGKSFQVFKLRDKFGFEMDISLPRRDRKVSSGHRGFETVADKDMSVEEAASRRDFTINAIYKDFATGEVVDPFNGLTDLENKVIRMVDRRAFAEDPLRVLRAVQFASRFGFNIDVETVKEMFRASESLQELPSERVFTEVEKILMKSERPSVGLSLLPALGLFPELEALEGVPQDPEWHPEGNVFVHTMMVVDEAAKIAREQRIIENFTRAERLTLMLAALSHDFGKAATTEMLEGRIRALNHEEAGVEPTLAFLDRLNIHTIDGFPVRDTVVALVTNHLFPAQLMADKKANRPRAMRRMSQKVRLDLLAMVSLADLLGRSTSIETKFQNTVDINQFVVEAESLGVSNREVEPVLKGRDLLALGHVAGKELGDKLRLVLELQLDGQVTTREEALLALNERGLL